MKGKIDFNNTIKDYYSVTLHIGHKSFRKAIHRLVAEAFIDNPNPSEYNIINYKDENKFNNRYDNLDVSSISKRINNKANCYKEYTFLVI